MPVTVRERLARALGVLCALTGALMLFSAPAVAKEVHVFSSSFGSPGSGPGELKEPYGVGVNDETGAVYVADMGNNRVEQFAFDSTTKAYEYVAEFNGAAAITGVFESPEAIAVDNSASALDPSKEDVYVADEGHDVIDRFTASGTYLGQLSETSGGSPFGELQGIAVDPAGNVLVYENGGHVDEFSDTGSFVKRLNTERGTHPGLAVDSSDDAYVIFPNEEVGKLDLASGTQTAEFGSSASALAIDASTNDLFVERGSSIVEYGPFGEPSSTPVEQFTTEGLERAFGLAVDGNTGAVYVTQNGAGGIQVFAEVLQPDVSTGEASGLQSEGAATLHGTVDPDGLEVTSCRFEYGTTTAYGSTAECSPSPGSGSAPAAVSTDLAGLIAPGTLYHYRLVAGNVNGEDLGQDQTFVAGARPLVSGESVSDVSLGEATVGAQINPGGLSSTYQVEYGPSTAYGSLTSEISAGAGTEASGVQVRLSGLQPSSLYHARIVARNEFGVVPGGDLTFTTTKAGGTSGSALPDNRAYEIVSLPADADGEAYHPFTGHELPSGHQLRSSYAVRASANGDAVAYDAEAPASGGSGSTGDGGGNTFLARRGTSEWSPTDIMPPVQAREVYAGFSSDLLVSFLQEFELPLTPDASANCEVLYSRTSDGAYRALFTAADHCAASPRFAGVSTDGSSVIFESQARLTPEAPEGSEEAGNLYDSVNGRLYLANVLPNGMPDADAAFGGVSQESDEETVNSHGYHHYGQVISADGSRIVWSDLSTGDLYVRKDAASPSASTVLVAIEGYYRGASADGSKILFTRGGDLYEYDVDTEATTDLAPGGSVLGLLGVSAGASYVYFVADGVLAGNENAHGEKPAAGQPNLYLDVAGNTRFIATLSPQDNEMVGEENAESPERGDWRAALNLRTAEVTSDGRSVVFMSRRSITGYDNEGGCTTPEAEPAGCSEVFVYDADSQELSCASCSPSGAPPVAALGHEGRFVGGAFLQTPNRQPGAAPVSDEPSYQLREISEDGSRVFFDTAEPLVPQDSNGAEDVYEWERSGSGTCHESRGCVYLISGALSSEEAVFLDASASGDDVFFTTRAQLVPQDRNELIDVYDARVDGGFVETSLACTGTGCQGVPSAPPTFATPSSATFSGIGNFPPPTPSKVKPKPKKRPVKCKKGFAAKHGKCVRQKKKAGKARRPSKRHVNKGRK
ncbi:MAG TPA: hypothetical protein VGL68_05870 [Solirubrobacteraceae bacterium]|jgi:DNA-binding beta-propeller fold protein YncE